MSPPSMTGPHRGGPYRQVQCVACESETAADVCPLCKRPVCSACHESRAELGQKTLQSVRETQRTMDLRAEDKAARKEFLEHLAYTLGAGVGISAFAMAFKGLQAIMLGAVLIPILTLNEVIEWRKYRKATRKSRDPWPKDSGLDDEVEVDVAALAPCSASCWGATGMGQDLIHSSAALYYGIYCQACLPRQPRSHAQAIAASRLLRSWPLKMLSPAPGHPAPRDAHTCARALELKSGTQIELPR